MAASTCSTSTEAIGLNPEIRLPDKDVRLLIVVVLDTRLMTEEGEVDLGVDSSELAELKLLYEAICGSELQRKYDWRRISPESGGHGFHNMGQHWREFFLWKHL